MLTPTLEVFRSPRATECEERAFVLTAVGVPSFIDFDGLQYILRVEEAAYTTARAHLDRYTLESRPTPAAPPPPKLHPFAWVGSAAYVFALVGIAYAVAAGVWRLDAFELGAADAARIKAGEWWRAWTALTLHVDGAHLLANLGAGAWFGYLAGRHIGPGKMWLLAVLGAGLANLLEALLGPASHSSVGASTAVFTVLGLFAAYTWRERFHLPQRWALRWGPLIAGVLLLGWMGSAGERTDVVAHVSGFLVGTATGALVALPGPKRAFARLSQRAAGLLAASLIVVAWLLALTS